AGGEEELELAALLLVKVWPAKVSERPEVGRRPSVEHVGVLLPVLGIGRTIDAHVDVLRVVVVYLVPIDALAIPDGDAVAPPQLAADAPVLDVLQPVQVSLFPALGEEADDALLHGALCLLDS